MKIVIEAHFEPQDDMEAEYGPSGVQEALMHLGLFDLDIAVEADDD